VRVRVRVWDPCNPASSQSYIQNHGQCMVWVWVSVLFMANPAWPGLQHSTWLCP